MAGAPALTQPFFLSKVLGFLSLGPGRMFQTDMVVGSRQPSLGYLDRREKRMDFFLDIVWVCFIVFCFRKE